MAKRVKLAEREARKQAELERAAIRLGQKLLNQPSQSNIASSQQKFDLPIAEVPILPEDGDKTFDKSAMNLSLKKQTSVNLN